MERDGPTQHGGIIGGGGAGKAGGMEDEAETSLDYGEELFPSWFPINMKLRVDPEDELGGTGERAGERAEERAGERVREGRIGKQLGRGAGGGRFELRLG